MQVLMPRASTRHLADLATLALSANRCSGVNNNNLRPVGSVEVALRVARACNMGLEDGQLCNPCHDRVYHAGLTWAEPPVRA
jgi:hypothetical protein